MTTAIIAGAAALAKPASAITYRPEARVQCPHCRTGVRLERIAWLNGAGSSVGHADPTIVAAGEETFMLILAGCPECGCLIITARPMEWNSQKLMEADQEIVIWPRASTRPPVSPHVPMQVAADYNEAALVLGFSPKASAALSRRCLQAVLREQGYTQRDLAQQIDAVLPHLPGYIAPNVDAIRNIGNFAAHPTKSQASGEIVDVELGEAEWNLDVLDELFDFYYVQPAVAKQKRDALNAKLTAAGKQPMK